MLLSVRRVVAGARCGGLFARQQRWARSGQICQWSGGKDRSDGDTYHRPREAVVGHTSLGVTKKKKTSNTRRMYCFGCGADVVPSDQQARGEIVTSQKPHSYWNDRKREMEISKIQNWTLCDRCKALKKGGRDSERMARMALIDAPTAMGVFRTNVAKIMSLRAVVVYVVDARDADGTTLRSLRSYVGGNPVLLVLTRCDLLPAHASQDLDKLKANFAKRSSHLKPAEVHMTAIPEGASNEETSGVLELADSILNGRGERDVYVVGAANIGKSTLTDRLVDALVALQGADAFSSVYDGRRLKAVKKAKVTQSPVPGTTLQNVRVPCFEDFKAALWDTPGLSFDQTRHLYPLKDFMRIRAERPTLCAPQELNSNDSTGFELVLREKLEEGVEEPPFFVFRFRFKGSSDSTTRLVWSPLYATVVAEVRPLGYYLSYLKEQQLAKVEEPTAPPEEEDEERRKRRESMSKEEWKRVTYEAYVEKVTLEQERIGMEEWKLEKEKNALKLAEEVRRRKLKKDPLVVVKPGIGKIIPANFGVDIVVHSLGSLGLVAGKDVTVDARAFSAGARVAHYPSHGLPAAWPPYEELPFAVERKDEFETLLSSEDEEDDDDDDDVIGYEEEDEFEKLGLHTEFNFEDLEDGAEVYDEYWGRELEETRGDDAVQVEDVWADRSGEKIGWRYSETSWSANGRTKSAGWFKVTRDEIVLKNIARTSQSAYSRSASSSFKPKRPPSSQRKKTDAVDDYQEF